MKTKTEDGIKKVKDVLASEDAAAIKKATEDLGSIVQGMGASFYQQPGAAGPEAGAGAGPEPEQGPASSGPADGDVVDGEFKNV